MLCVRHSRKMTTNYQRSVFERKKFIWPVWVVKSVSRITEHYMTRV